LSRTAENARDKGLPVGTVDLKQYHNCKILRGLAYASQGAYLFFKEVEMLCLKFSRIKVFRSLREKYYTAVIDHCKKDVGLKEAFLRAITAKVSAADREVLFSYLILRYAKMRTKYTLRWVMEMLDVRKWEGGDLRPRLRVAAATSTNKNV
jgi:hypothetical protein